MSQTGRSATLNSRQNRGATSTRWVHQGIYPVLRKAMIAWSTSPYLKSIGQNLPLPIIELHFGEQRLESRIAVKIAG
jgi:hypothetical protein